MESCLVTQTIYAYLTDADDVDRDPDKHAAQGNIRLEPIIPKGETLNVGGETIALAPHDARIQNGQIMHRGQVGLRIPHHEGVRWKATYTAMQANGWSFTMKPKEFTTTPGGTTNLGATP
ncbi:hypothetical protein [Corynebacterium sp. A21]|uniref:hypothetical protein n=1 Tax=Corynebacterium sp. A21 TaxID=3457318 RepID=UPI003FD1DA50